MHENKFFLLLYRFKRDERLVKPIQRESSLSIFLELLVQ